MEGVCNRIRTGTRIFALATCAAGAISTDPFLPITEPCGHESTTICAHGAFEALVNDFATKHEESPCMRSGVLTCGAVESPP